MTIVLNDRLRGLAASGALRIAMAAGIAQAIGLAASPILSRMYSPKDFAALGVVIALTSIVASAGTLRLEVAALVPEDEESAWVLRTAAVIVAALVCALVTIGLQLASTPLASLFGVPSAAGLLWLCGPAAFVVAWFQADNVMLARRSSHNRLAARQLVQGGGQVATQLALVSRGAAGLCMGFVAGRMMSLVLGPRRPEHVKVSAQNVRELVSRYRRFPLVSTWSAVLNTAGQMVPLLVIGALYGAADSGQFAFTFRVMLAPVALVSLAYSQVFIGRITASRSSLGPVARSTARRLTIIGALPVAALGLLGPWLFPLLFGSTWSVAGWMALLLTPMLMAQVVVSPVSQVVNVCERQDLMLVWDVARLIVMIVVPVAAAALSSSALVGVAAMSFTGLLCYGVLWLLVLRVAGAKP